MESLVARVGWVTGVVSYSGSAGEERTAEAYLEKQRSAEESMAVEASDTAAVVAP